MSDTIKELWRWNKFAMPNGNEYWWIYNPNNEHLCIKDGHDGQYCAYIPMAVAMAAFNGDGVHILARALVKFWEHGKILGELAEKQRLWEERNESIRSADEIFERKEKSGWEIREETINEMMIRRGRNE